MNNEALQQALEEIHDASFHWALSCCHWHHHNAEELLQACYLKVLDGRAKFRGDSSVKTWFFAVIKNTAREQYRRQRIMEAGYLKVFRETIARQDEVMVFEPDLDEPKERLKIKKALMLLPGRQREIIELVFYQELTIEEAAKICGVGLGTARTHYDRAKKKMFELLKQYEH